MGRSCRCCCGCCTRRCCKWLLVPLLAWVAARVHNKATTPPRVVQRCAAEVGRSSRPQTSAGLRATFCNPLDLPYKFQGGERTFREAADPSVVIYKDTYFLFASHSGGYWYSSDLNNWTFVVPQGIPVDDYAPTALVMDDGKIYWTASHSGAVFTTEDPFQGHWYSVGGLDYKYHDPFLFQDDDKKVYFSWGCSPIEPIYIVPVDPRQGFRLLSAPHPVIAGNQTFHGWESAKFNPLQSAQSAAVLMLTGDRPFIEGSWINKVNGRYYHQYATPGTELKAYGDGVYVSSVSPLGPYTRDNHNPVSHKPSGFIAGAGHGSTFQDLKGQWWHVCTGLISVRHNFERRVMLFPAYFEPEHFPSDFRAPGVTTPFQTVPSFLVDTMLGDFPRRFDQSKPGWQLLSLFKKVTASSTLSRQYRESYAVDEDISTWWSATGDVGEWLAVDTGSMVTVHAVQINFADQDALAQGRLDDAYRYFCETSEDGKVWKPVEELDRRNNERDSSQDYTELTGPLVTRHFRITSSCVPGGARFSLSGLRLFGHGEGQPPEAVATLHAVRDVKDRRTAKILWVPSAGAQYYVVRWGLQGGPLFQNLQVYGNSQLLIESLSTDMTYSFVVDAVNEAGLTRGTGLTTA